MLNEQASSFMLLESEVEREFRSHDAGGLAAQAVAETVQASAPTCPPCVRPMKYHDSRPVGWLACWGRVHALTSR